MPQKYDFSDLPDQPNIGGPIRGPIDFSDLPDQVQQQKREPTWGDTLITGGLRVVPALAGGIAGTVFGGPLGGAGAGMALSGLGETAAQWYERNYGLRDEYNPLQIGVQTGLGGIGGFVKAPAQLGGKALAKYAGLNALEGAALNAAAEVPTQLAETGELPSLKQVGLSAGVGGVFGGTVGAGAGKYIQSQLPRPDITPPTPRMSGAAPPLPPEATPQVGIGPSPSVMAARVPPDKITRREWTPEMVDYFHERGYEQGVNPEGYEFMARPGVTPPPPDPMDALRANIAQQTPNQLPETFTPTGSTTLADLEIKRNQGYVSVEGLRDSQGRAMMVRGDIAPLYVNRPNPPQAAPPETVKRPDIASTYQEGEIGINEGQDIEMPRAYATQRNIDRMANEGYRVAEETPEGMIIFRKADPVTTEELSRVEQRTFGDDEGQPIREGEMTGRVARFPGTRESEQIDQLLEKQRTQGLTELENTQLGLLQEDLQDIRNGIDPYKHPTGPIPREPELGDPLPEVPRDRFGNKIMNEPPRTPDEVREYYERTRNQYKELYDSEVEPGPNDPIWRDPNARSIGIWSGEEKTPLGPRGVIQGGVTGEPTGDINALRNQSQLQRVGEPSVTEEDVDWGWGPSPTMEQFAPQIPQRQLGTGAQEPEVLPALDEFGYPADRDLTWDEVEHIKAGIRARERAYYGGDIEEARIGEQAVDDQVAGIVDVPEKDFRVEQATEGDNKGIFTQIKNLTTRFLNDESGELTPGAMVEHIRQMVSRRRAKSRPDADVIESDVLGSHEDSIQAQHDADLNEIQTNTDAQRARDIALFWREEFRREYTTSMEARAGEEPSDSPGFSDGERHASRMLTQAEHRLQELGAEPLSYTGMEDRVSGPERTRRADLAEITDNEDPRDLAAIEVFWRGQVEHASERARGGIEYRHALRMLEAVEARIAEVAAIQSAPITRNAAEQAIHEDMMEADRQHIAESDSVELAQDRVEHWEEMHRLRDVFNDEDRLHNLNMLELARERLAELQVTTRQDQWEVYPDTTTPGMNTAESQAASASATTDAARERDVLEITNSDNIADIQRIGERWDEIHTHATESTMISYSRYMRNLAEARVRELRGSNAANLNTLSPEARENNRYEIEYASTADDLAELIRQWQDRITRFGQSYDVSSQAHADTMLRMARDRYTAITGQSAPSQPVRVQNEPVATGPRQVSKEKVQLSKEKYDRIASQVGAGRRAQVARTVRTERHHRPNHWDNWAKEQLDKIADGPPGLSVEENRVRYYDKSWNVVYRDTDGKPLALAVVDQHSNGRRTTDTLASNRFKGFASGRAVNAVIKTVFEMNGGEFTGSISDYTANLIMKLVDAVSNVAGSFEIGGIVKSLMRIKSDLLAGKPLFRKKFNTPEDMLNALEKMSGDKSIGWLAGNAATNERPTDLVAQIPTPDGGQAVQIPNGPVVSQETFGRMTAEAEELSRMEQAAPAGPGMMKKMKQATGIGMGGVVPPKPKLKKGQKKKPETNHIIEAANVSTALTTTMDLSAPGRQGLSQVFTKEFWKAILPSIHAGISADAKAKIDLDLMNKPLFRRRFDPKTATFKPSFAEEVGMKLVGGGDTISGQEGSVATRWVESIPGLGIPIRMSNRAYATFLNHLRANRFEKLMNAARDMSIKGDEGKWIRPGLLPTKINPLEAQELNPFNNKVLAKEIADFVNTATGRGPLKMHVLPYRKAEVNLEGAAKYLSAILFSPRLIASRMRMLNPNTYIMATPYVRKQYLKSMLAAGGAWAAMTEIAKNASDEVEVSTDPLSADFGKIKIGETRLDPGASFQQFMVAYSRFWTGEYASSSTGERHRYGSGFQAQTQLDAGERLFANKLNPVTKFAYDLLSATEYQPFHVVDRAAQMFVPLVAQDIWELGHDNPDLIPPFLLPIIFGMGTQTYSKGESVGKFIDPENDILVTGGGPAEWMPWRQE